MSEGESTRSKWFWWVMGIAGTVIAAVVIAVLNLEGGQPPGPDFSGTYSGQAYNGGLVGNVLLKVDKAVPAGGAATAQVTWSGNLNGGGPMRGTFTANIATFQGEIASATGPWNIQMSCTFGGSHQVTCDYMLQALPPNYLAAQRGSLTAVNS